MRESVALNYANRSAWVRDRVDPRPAAGCGRHPKSEQRRTYDRGVTMSTRAEVAPFHNPLAIRLVLEWLRKHGRRFYNFDGLDSFKAKLRPANWEPVFAVSNEPQVSFKTLYAIASAFSGNAPFRLIGGGLAKAVTTEMGWLKRRFFRS